MHIASGDLWAGAEVQLFNLACELHQAPDIALQVVLLNHGLLEERLRERGIAVTVIDERRHNALAIGHRLLRLMRATRPDVVHTHREKENVLGAIAAWMSRVPVCLRTVHGRPEHHPPRWAVHKHAIRWLDRACGRHLQQAVVAVAGPVAQALASQFPRDRIRTIENGIAIDDLRARATQPHDKPIPGAPDTFKIAIVCRLSPVKRIDLFLAIARETVRRHPGRYEFYIIGDGPLHEYAAGFIHQNALDDTVHMPGFVPDTAPFLSRMDALMITSDHEGLPINLLEAMTLGVPVIAHAVGGIVDVLESRDCGVLIETQATALYVEALEHLSSDTAAHARIKDNARAHVSAHYSATRCAKRYRSLYQSLLQERLK